MKSIRRRLLLWLLIGLTVVLAVSGYVTYRQARAEINALFDYQLQQTALTLRHQNMLSLLLDSKAGESQGDLLVQIWDRRQRLFYISRKSHQLPFADRSGFSTLNWRNESWRRFVLYLGGRVLQVAQPLRVRQQMSADIALRNLAPFLLLLPGMGLVVWFGVGRGLQPLYRLATDLQHRQPDTLKPVATAGLASEILPLVQALNGLMARLAQTLDTQRQFIDDAAHELRTPLTAIRLQADLAQQATDMQSCDEAFDDLRGGLERATHLVEQLLAMARLDTTPVMDDKSRSVDLRALAQSVIAEHASIADARGLDLGLLPGDAVFVEGNGRELRTLLGNLIDNALRYTPAGGQVDVQVYRESSAAVLIVSDTGAGIPVEEQSRVFDRFYRGADTTMPGSGLGLAIVKRIADRHQASITLSEAENGSGLRVTVRCPCI